MAESSRLDDLRRRVEKDPASIAFAQLAEEYRRAGQLEDAVSVCRAGLKIHPSYLSARVTLGRALLELETLDEAQQELDHVLRSAPENLAALRGLAEIHHRRGDLVQALTHYRSALALARNDPDLEQTVNDLALQVEPAPPGLDEALPLEPLERLEPLEHRVMAETPGQATVADPEPDPPDFADVASLVAELPNLPTQLTAPASESSVEGVSAAVAVEEVPEENPSDAGRARALLEIAALERWLEAIHVARADHHA